MNIIGIAGYARCGKDTFAEIAKNILSKNGYFPVRIAFADELKEEVSTMLSISGFKASAYDEDVNNKKFIRPLLVWWGCQRRHESENGLYWVRLAEQQVKHFIASHLEIPIDKIVFLVSDVRFLNEVDWIKKDLGGIVIHIKRWEYKKFEEFTGKKLFLKIYGAAPNEEEKIHDPIVMEAADHKIEWQNLNENLSDAVDNIDLKKIVLDTLNITKYFSEKPLL